MIASTTSKRKVRGQNDYNNYASKVGGSCFKRRLRLLGAGALVSHSRAVSWAELIADNTNIGLRIDTSLQALLPISAL